MECIVHFEAVHRGEGEIAKLRGLVMTEEGKKPTPLELEEMFQMMGYNVRCADEDSLIFVPKTSDGDIEELRVKKLDIGEESYTPDMQLRAIAEQLMSKPNRPM
ncbi:dipeptidyl aminopeptidase [Paenibacillus dendritiformis]|uniref:dipeptidyl aminopeptidase n=1 Tax=Paenibacillus TaxID=44249 RepID=UPI00105A54C9|nr:dipeptidyl aminopeptidase [Paenibacillus dendritiformis]TDL52835.1 dipeptidyl aminopeptidase [Paenibacillus dendritiformis]WGU92907.1 dipeptidyl aminopeptidase [Paenibacillus dendritiformis]